jgi:D-amino-acid oxidase
VVNCTGLSSRSLGGVEDQSVYPARGQIVLVRNDPKVMASVSGTDDGGDEATYIMHRAAGGGCILGGSFQQHSWESQPDPSLAIRIMKRCVELCPDLTGGKGIEHLSIIRHGVGLRPLRAEGPRVEREKIDGVDVVHQYGHGGYGYQASYGSAMEAVRLVEEAGWPGKARL